MHLLDVTKSSTLVLTLVLLQVRGRNYGGCEKHKNKPLFKASVSVLGCWRNMAVQHNLDSTIDEDLLSQI